MLKARQLNRFENRWWHVFVAPVVIAIVFSCMPAEAQGESSSASKVDSAEQQKALEILMLLAYEGDAESQYELAILFTQGVGVMPNFGEAFFWFSRAAEQGYVDAQYRVGSAYLNGKGVDPDQQKGLEWWRKASEGGSLPALYHLGRAYFYGVGVKSDLAEAKRLLQLAADIGSEQADILLREIDIRSNADSALSVPDWVRIGDEAVWVYASFNRLSPMIEQLPPDSLLKVKERRGGWYRVDLPGGLPLWIETQHAIIDSDGLLATVTKELVEARSEPSSSVDSLVLGWLQAGEEVPIVGVRGEWVRVRVLGRHTAWVEALAVQEESKAELESNLLIGGATEALDLPEPTVEITLAENPSVPSSAVHSTEGQVSQTKASMKNQAASLGEMPSFGLWREYVSRQGVGNLSLDEENVGVTQKVVVNLNSVSHGESRLEQSPKPLKGTDTIAIESQEELVPVNEEFGNMTAKRFGTNSGQNESATLVGNDYEWLFSQDKSGFTIELMSITSEMLVRRFLREAGFHDYITYFTLSEGSRTWHMALHGSYQVMKEVRQALQSLPITLDAIRVRRFGPLQDRLCGSFDDLPVSELKFLELHCSSVDG